ncbi:acyl-CoA synthetase [Janibacter alittae]|uniref:Long-chain fatty acid--CoA ligase n=1 Tax=Janibacter alittae TaxID=3115209 RepID=A0ABZ2MLU3_9MICO
MDHGFGSWATIHHLRNADRVAYVDGLAGVQTTYAQLEERTNRLADALRAKGVSHGERVALLCLNSPQMMEIYLAVAKLGAISVPVNFRLHPDEIAHVLSDSGASLLFVSTPFVDAATQALASGTSVRETIRVPALAEREAGEGGDYEPLVSSGASERVVADVGHDDVCVIMYTSGTTGRPKGAMLTHGNFFYNAINAMGFASGIGRTDVTISAAPLFHIGALGVHTLPFLFVGAGVVVIEAFTPDQWVEAAARHHVTQAFLVPAMWAAVAASPALETADLSSLRLAISGGAPCPLPVISAMKSHGVAFTEGFGMTETSPNAACLQPEDVVEHAGSVGRPVAFMDFRILDEMDQDVPVGHVGELCLRGPSVFVGYWDKPEATAEAIRDGWFHTGDMARVDEEGFYSLVDRKKDMIITGGENVYPIEVEQVLYGHPDVVEVAVIGVLDETWGETVAAVVVRAADSSLTADGLREWARERISHFKAPRRVAFVDELPRNATGKILKRELRITEGGGHTAVSR